MLGLLTPRRKLRRKKAALPKIPGKKIGLIFLLLVIAVSVFSYFFVYVPYTKIRAQGEAVMQAGREAKAAFQENDIDLLEERINNVESQYNAFQKESSSVYWMGYIPFAGLYVQDFKNAVEAGGHLIDAGKKTIVAIKPHADLIGFKKDSDASFTEKPAELRLQTAVLTLDQIVQDVDAIAVDVDQARDKIDTINPNRYPKKVGDREVRPLIENSIAQFDGLATLFVDAKPFIKALPDILGADEKKTYLFLFMNDKELRATGGFLTAYAVFDVDQGKFSVQRSDDIYTLDNSIPTHPKAPREIAQYHKNVSRLYIRDSNLSPDFPTSIEMFDELYQDSSQKVDYDGIIAVDTHVLVDALEVLGDTQARGLNFSAEEDSRCDCPQVIYTLLDEIDRPVAYIKADRKGILGDLLLTLMQKALGFSPSKYWGRLSQQLITNMQEKHILVYMKDPELQKAVEAMNFAGEIRETEGDYLHISDVNFAGAKSNLFVQHDVESKTIIGDDGTVKRELTLTYRNPEPHSNCSLEEGGELGEGGLCINATLRNWLRIYVPEGSSLDDFKGSEKKIETYDELGKTVYEGFLTVKPEGQAKAVITYTLPFKVENESDYSLLIQKQPGTVGHDYTVLVNGAKIYDEPLIRDATVKMPQ